MSSSHNLTVNIGQDEIGAARNAAYRKAAESENLSLGGWIKKHLDKAAKLTIDGKVDKQNLKS